MRFPLFIPFLCCIAGILSAACLQTDSSLLLLFSTLIALLSLLLVFFNFRRLAFLFIAVSITGLFAGRVQLHDETFEHSVIEDLLTESGGKTELHRITAEVIRILHRYEEKLSAEIIISEIASSDRTIKLNEKVRLNIYLSDHWKGRKIDLNYGDKIIFPGNIQIIKDFDTPGVFDIKADSRRKLLHGTINLNTPLLIERLPDSFNFLELFHTYHQLVSEKIINHFNLNDPLSDEGEILLALSTGDRDYIDDEMQDSLRRSGLMHIIAISGFHVGVVAFTFMSLFRAFGMRRSWSDSLLILLLVFYWLITGYGIATTRATLLAIGWIISRAVGRPASGLNTLSLIGLILLIINPYDLFNPGFQLSFAAAFGLFSFPVVLHSLLPFTQRLPRFLTATVSAQLWTYPLIMVHFNQVVIQALITNFILLPILSVVVVICACYVMVLHWIPVVGGLVLDLVSLIMVSARFFLTLTMDLFPWHFRAPGPQLPLVIFSFLCMFIAYLLHRYNGSRWLIVACLIVPLVTFSVVLLVNKPDPGPRLAVLDSGMSDTNIITLKDGRIVVVDAAGSPLNRFDYGEYVVSKYLWHENITCIDYLILTHFDADHAEGAIALLENFSIGTLLVPVHHVDNALSHEILSLAARKGVRTKKIHRGFNIYSTNMQMHFLNPPATAFDGKDYSNNNGLIMQLQFDNWQILFTADAEKPVLRSVASHIRNSSLPSIVKVAHHGSRDALDPELYGRLPISLALISAGRENVYGFPHQETLDFFRQEEIPILVTGEDGTIVVELENSSEKFVAHLGREAFIREFSLQ